MLWRDLRAVQIYGSNTNVGKSVLSTLLCKALERTAPGTVSYLKPVSTGPRDDSDSAHIHRYLPALSANTLFHFDHPVSPHLAARWSRKLAPQKHGKSDPSDSAITEAVRSRIALASEKGYRHAIVETAGGPLSPAPSGTLQADLYRPLRLPVILFGDHRLGGIGATISAYESLHVRGYDVDSVVLFEDKTFGNYDYLRHHFDKQSIDTIPLPPVPLRAEKEDADRESMAKYYEDVSSSTPINTLVDVISRKHHFRISNLSHMLAATESVLWHPFRQHSIPHDLLVIDSAFGDCFQGLNKGAMGLCDDGNGGRCGGITPIRQHPPEPLLEPVFDGSASWWTQGLGHGNSDLALTAAHHAGRYGHVMFASAVHAPALRLATRLLELLANPRLSRVFYSDNGSTGVEVALKMALRSSAKRYGWTKDDGQLGVLGLRGSYHGDCIATMNCCEPSPFNETVDWYRPWGWWFDPPTWKFSDGMWRLTTPDEGPSGPAAFPNLAEIFDFRHRSQLGHTQVYEEFISSTLQRLIGQEGRKFGALICEPILMGAGGMIFVDPLFQRTLIKVVREQTGPLYGSGASSSTTLSSGADATSWTGLPIIADEVLSGLYRLGRPSSSSFMSMAPSAPQLDLDISPDISVHAKLLTGGLLPLAVTAASESIFETFLSERKQDALLHGHSYTAHPVGCGVAEKSLSTLLDLDRKGAWRGYQMKWQAPSPSGHGKEAQDAKFWSFWSPDLVQRLSGSGQVQGVVALGSVLVIHLRTGDDVSGYTSNAANGLREALQASNQAFRVHSRVLGNVLYLMASMTSQAEDLASIETTLLKALA